MFTILEEKRRKLKEDKDNCDLAYGKLSSIYISLFIYSFRLYILDVVLESQSRLHKRNLRRRGPENSDNKTNKRKQMNDILFYIYLYLYKN